MITQFYKGLPVRMKNRNLDSLGRIVEKVDGCQVLDGIPSRVWFMTVDGMKFRTGVGYLFDLNETQLQDLSDKEATEMLKGGRIYLGKLDS